MINLFNLIVTDNFRTIRVRSIYYLEKGKTLKVTYKDLKKREVISYYLVSFKLGKDIRL